MPLTQKHRNNIIAAYCILFYLLMLYKAWNGLLLSQLQPHLFSTRFDMVSWLVMQTGIHQWLIDNRTGWIVFDIAFYAMPLLYWLIYKKSERVARITAVLMLLVNWVYVQCFTLFPSNSIEGHTAWLLFPFLLMTANLRSFWFVLHGLRYFFLFFFASAGVWKLVQGGFFNMHEMSGVLLYQHKEYLASSPGHWYTSFVYWLIQHPSFSYCLYVGGAILELLFFTGFFTRRYDYYLAAAFILFAVFDVLVMRIPYWEVSPFLITLLYSKYSLPAEIKKGRYRNTALF